MSALFGSPQQSHLPDQSSGWKVSARAGLWRDRLRSRPTHSSRSASDFDWMYSVYSWPPSLYLI